MRQALRRAILVLLPCALAVTAQTSEGENITRWNPCNTGGLLDGVDTLWMGGVFLRDTSKPCTVTLHGNGAGINGCFYVMVPGYPDSAYYLMHNHQAPGTVVDVSMLDIPHMDTLYFMYAYPQDSVPTNWRNYDHARFTGPNRRASDGVAEGAPAGGWVNTDRYSSDDTNTSLLPCNNFANYRRWAVAGWLQDDDGSGGRKRTDTVAFGFEDLTIGDGDFDDVVFYVTGVFLNRPNIVEDLVLEAEPANSVIAAGDSVVFTAHVYLDSLLEDGSHIIINRPAYDAQVTWWLSPHPGNPDLKYGSGPYGTNTFYAERAWADYTVRSSFVDPLGNEQSAAMTISVVPGPPDHLVIEASPDSSGVWWGDNPRSLLTLGPGDQSSEAFYAILRDEYENWIGPADPVVWDESNAAAVVASVGTNPGLGQGHAERQVDLNDSSLVIARFAVPGTGNVLTDDMLVRLESIYYIQLRIGIRQDLTFTTINNLDIETIGDTTLYVQGLTVNGGWEYLDASWTAQGIVLNPGSASGISWTFSPEETGDGTITATTTNTADGSPLSVNTNVHITYGDPEDMLLYPASGDPATMSPLPATTQITAGESLTLVAKMFDIEGGWLSTFELDSDTGQLITWEVNTPTGATLLPLVGHATQFSSNVAHRSYRVTARYNHGGTILSASVDVHVNPAAPAQLVIEPASDFSASPNAPNPCDTVTVSSEETEKMVYAVLRDGYGNYVSPSKYTLWESADSTTVIVSSSNPDTGRGTVARNPAATSGSVLVAAQDAGSGLRDTTVVSILPYYYTQLAIVSGDGVEIDSLVMTTNDDTALYVRGQRSDNAAWESVSALWTLEASLLQALAVPGERHSCLLSPTEPAAGTIRVTIGDTSITQSDAVQVRVVGGGAVQLVSELVTPVGSTTAGSPLEMVLHAYDSDGNGVSGTWCTSVTVSDNLPAGPSGAAPSVVIDSDTLPMDSALTVCFVDGETLLEVLLYHAPANRSPHTITVSVAGQTALVDSTEPFILNAGPLSDIAIVDNKGHVLDTVFLSAPDGFQVFIAEGYDAWGNARGHELCDWSVQYTPQYVLHPIERPDNVFRVFYSTATTDNDGEGWMHAVDATTGTVRDSVYVYIRVAARVLISAFTADTNGNGYLDRLLLGFSGEVSLPGDSASIAAILENIDIAHASGTEWSAAGIVGTNGTMTDTVFVVTLVEEQNGLPQTAMLPELRWIDIPNLQNLSMYTDAFSHDGAGPVIWEINNYIQDGVPDRVEVTLSEPVQHSNGSSLSLQADALAVSDLFRVYDQHAGTGEYVLREGVLDGIVLSSVHSDSVVVFEMTNGADLNVGNYMDLLPIIDNSGPAPDTSFLVTDRVLDPLRPPNPPVFGNKKVVVNVQGYRTPDPDDDGTGCGGCGTGVEQALLPMVWFGARTLGRRKRKRARRTS